MNIRRWIGREGEVRYYFDLRFGGAPFMSWSGNAKLNGRWIGRGEDGLAHIYAKTQFGYGYCRTEDGEWLDKAFFGRDGATWEKWEADFQACLTKSGRFSVAKYIKLEV